ncbi:MAG: ferrous iron transport protein B, partial [Anaerotruncus colihominis]
TATLPAALAQIFTPAAAVAFLTFTLLYTPCVAAIAAVRRELGGRYAVTMAAGQCLIAWAAAFLVYHAARLIF